jgi:hypothetical protein
MLQLVLPRDPNTGFYPQDQWKLEAADAARMLLSKMLYVAQLRLKKNGWNAVGSGNSAGSHVYEHSSTGEQSEEPLIIGTTWQGNLLQSLGKMMAPGMFSDGRVVWAARVVQHNRGDGAFFLPEAGLFPPLRN